MRLIENCQFNLAHGAYYMATIGLHCQE